MYLLVDSATSQVLHAQPSVPTAGSGQIVVSVTSDPLLADTLSNPTAYWWSGTALGAWPSLTARYVDTTLTVTLEASTAPRSWTAPTSATVAIPGTMWTASVALSSGSGTTSLAMHSSLAAAQVLVSVTATATQMGLLQLGTDGGTAIGLQVIPATASSPALVAPTGTGSLAYLRAFYLGLTPQTQVAVLTEAMQNLMITVGITNRLLTEKIVPMLQANSYTPLSLTSAEAAAITNWTQTVQANMVSWADLLDGSGTPIAPYSELQAQAPTVLSAMQSYATAAATLPNLE